MEISRKETSELVDVTPRKFIFLKVIFVKKVLFISQLITHPICFLISLTLISKKAQK